jgi:hypothetical protein
MAPRRHAIHAPSGGGSSSNDAKESESPAVTIGLVVSIPIVFIIWT